MALDLTKPVTPPPAHKREAASANKRNSAKVTSGREEAVNGLFQIAGALCLMAGQLPDAGTCAMHGPEISKQAALVAESNEGVAKVIDYITAVGPYAGLLAAAMPFALQILVNHKRIPPGLMGTVAPEMLAAQAETDLLHQQEAVMRELEAAQRMNEPTP